MTNQTKSQMFQYNISTHRAPLGRARDASTPSPSGENTEAVALFLNEKGSISNEKLFPEGNFFGSFHLPRWAPWLWPFPALQVTAPGRSLAHVSVT